MCYSFTVFPFPCSGNNRGEASLVQQICAAAMCPHATVALKQHVAEALSQFSHHKACHTRFASSACTFLSSNDTNTTVAGFLLDFTCSHINTQTARENAAMALINAGLLDTVRDAAASHGIDALVDLVTGSWNWTAQLSKRDVTMPQVLYGHTGPSAAKSGLRTAMALRLLARLSRSAAAMDILQSTSKNILTFTNMAVACLQTCGGSRASNACILSNIAMDSQKKALRNVSVLSMIKHVAQVISFELYFV